MRNLAFTSDSPQSIKLGDSNDVLSLRVTESNQPVDLSKVSSITVKIGNASGFLTDINVDVLSLQHPTDGIIDVVISSKISSELPAGQYLLEVWIEDAQGNIVIYPDTSYPTVIGFSIKKNIMTATSTVITTLTLADFETKFAEMQEDLQYKAASGYFKGDKGDTGVAGQSVWYFPYDVGANVLGRWWSNLKPAPTTANPPKVGDSIIDLVGNVYQITNVVVGTAQEGGGTFDYGDLLTIIKGPKGDKGDPGDKGNTGTVDNTGLISAPAFQSLQTQVDNSTVGTNLLINTSSSLTNLWTTMPGVSASVGGVNKYNRTDSYEQVTAAGTTVELYYRFMLPSITNLYGLIPGKTYTLSGSASHTSGELKFRSEYGAGGGYHSLGDPSDLGIPISDGSVFTPFSYTFTVPVGATGVYISLQNDDYTAGGLFRFKYMKLEKGSVATDWSPNPSEILTTSDYAKIKAAIVALGGSLS